MQTEVLADVKDAGARPPDDAAVVARQRLAGYEEDFFKRFAEAAQLAKYMLELPQEAKDDQLKELERWCMLTCCLANLTEKAGNLTRKLLQQCPNDLITAELPHFGMEGGE